VSLASTSLANFSRNEKDGRARLDGRNKSGHDKKEMVFRKISKKPA
jgi:hypothetical protein